MGEGGEGEGGGGSDQRCSWLWTMLVQGILRGEEVVWCGGDAAAAGEMP